MRIAISILAALGALLDFGTGVSFAATQDKPVMVYYLPWYAAKPFSGDWGWHWTMNHFHPDQVNATGEREIASWYYPLIGPYDSADPAVLEYHVLLMKLAGIDGVIVDWYGSADYFDYAAVNRNATKLFDYTRKAGLKFAICYEDQTIQRLLDGNRLTRPTPSLTRSRKCCISKPIFSAIRVISASRAGRCWKTSVRSIFWPAAIGRRFSRCFDASNRPSFFTEDNPCPSAWVPSTGRRCG